MSGKFDKTTLSMLGRDGTADIQNRIISENDFKHKKVVCPQSLRLLQSREINDIPICDGFDNSQIICLDCPILWNKLRITEREKSVESVTNCNELERTDLPVDSSTFKEKGSNDRGSRPSSPMTLDSLSIIIKLLLSSYIYLPEDLQKEIKKVIHILYED